MDLNEVKKGIIGPLKNIADNSSLYEICDLINTFIKNQKSNEFIYDLITKSLNEHNNTMWELAWNTYCWDFIIFVLDHLDPKDKRTKELINEELRNFSRDYFDGTIVPLIDAVSQKQEPIIKKLLDLGADINKYNTLEDKPNENLMDAIIKTNNKDFFDFIIPKFKDLQQTRYLCSAIAKGYFHFVKELIRFGVDVNSKCYNNNTLLHMLISRGHGDMDIIKYLVENHGLNINTQNGYGNTPLIDMINTIYTPESNMQTLAPYRYTYADVLELIDLGADINIQNKVGDTAIILALKDKLFPIVQILMRNGANLDLKNRKGESFNSLVSKSDKETRGIIQSYRENISSA